MPLAVLVCIACVKNGKQHSLSLARAMFWTLRCVRLYASDRLACVAYTFMHNYENRTQLCSTYRPLYNWNKTLVVAVSNLNPVLMPPIHEKRTGHKGIWAMKLLRDKESWQTNRQTKCRALHYSYDAPQWVKVVILNIFSTNIYPVILSSKTETEKSDNCRSQY